MSSFPKHSFEQAYDHAFPGMSSEAHPQGRRSPALNADSPRHYSERSPLITKSPLTTESSYTYNDLPSGNRPYNKAPSATSASSVDTLLESRGAPDDHNNQGSSCGNESECETPSHLLSIRDLAVREFKILLRYSGPIVLTYSMQNSLQLASLLSLGRLGSIGKCVAIPEQKEGGGGGEKNDGSPAPWKTEQFDTFSGSGLCFFFSLSFGPCVPFVVFVIFRHASIVPHCLPHLLFVDFYGN